MPAADGDRRSRRAPTGPAGCDKGAGLAGSAADVAVVHRTRACWDTSHFLSLT